MLISPEIQQFQDSVSMLTVGRFLGDCDYSFSCPIDDPTTVHISGSTFYTVFLRDLAELGYPYFIHQDLRFGLCAVLYLPS